MLEATRERGWRLHWRLLEIAGGYWRVPVASIECGGTATTPEVGIWPIATPKLAIIAEKIAGSEMVCSPAASGRQCDGIVPTAQCVFCSLRGVLMLQWMAQGN